MSHIPARPEQIESALSLVASQTAQTFRSLEQQRTNLLRALSIAEKTRKGSALGSPTHIAAKARLTALNFELKTIREQTRGAKERSRLDRFLLEIIRERTDQTGRAQLVQEARERRAALEVLKMTAENLAVARDGAIALQPPPAP